MLRRQEPSDRGQCRQLRLLISSSVSLSDQYLPGYYVRIDGPSKARRCKAVFAARSVRTSHLASWCSRGKLDARSLCLDPFGEVADRVVWAGFHPHAYGARRYLTRRRPRCLPRGHQRVTVIAVRDLGSLLLPLECIQPRSALQARFRLGELPELLKGISAYLAVGSSQRYGQIELTWLYSSPSRHLQLSQAILACTAPSVPA